MRKSLLFCLLATPLLWGTTAQAQSPQSPQSPQPQKLYPDGPPQSNGLTPADEELTPTSLSHACDADYFLFLPPAEKATGMAVIICPGGGYGAVSYVSEGLLTAQWMADQGILAVVLRYRMPNGHAEIPLADLHETIRLVRRNATAWGVNPNQVGVMGFSAGGHLAATAATHFDDQTRPDFAVLVYPVISMDERCTHAGSRKNLLGPNPSEELVAYYSNELQVTAQTPRTFIAYSDNDTTVPPQSATLFYNALHTKGIPAELHIYATGGHGWGWKPEFRYHDELTTSLGRWLRGE